jgi:hypothetical protein
MLTIARFHCIVVTVEALRPHRHATARHPVERVLVKNPRAWGRGIEVMDPNLQKLIDLARAHKITPEEHQAQVRSFAYGNTHIENDSITRQDVDEAADLIGEHHISPNINV